MTDRQGMVERDGAIAGQGETEGGTGGAPHRADAGFSRNTLTVVIGVAAVSLLVAVVLTVLGDDLGDQRSAGVDGYSVSAIGHQGLVRLLQKLDLPVVVSRSNSGEKAQRGLLIVAEPAVSDAASRDRLARLVESAPRTLVVLPKWYGSTERGKTWLADASLLPIDEVTPVLEALSLEGPATIQRSSRPATWQADPAIPRPVIREPQMIASEALAAIVDDASGHLLLGHVERDGGRLYVLADPDVLSNFGLRDPANARFIVELIDRMRDGGPVVVDETLHGYAQQPSLVRTLFRFPLVLATLQVLVCAVLIGWSAMVRFGPRRAAPPPIAPGKDFLIRNTAALLQYGGHHAHALERYLQLTVGAVRHALHAPSLPPAEMTAWLERVRLVRGGTISLVELERAVDLPASPARVVELAEQVFRWRMEMTNGTDSRS